MIKRQVQKYPYSAITEHEIKMFLSDQICEQVVSIISGAPKNFRTIKNGIADKKKVIRISAVLIFVSLFGTPTEARPIGISPIITWPPEIHRPAPQHFHQHASTASSRLNKIRFLKASELPLYVYMTDGRFVGTPEVSLMIRKLRGGNLSGVLGNTIFLVLVYAIWVLNGGFSAFVQQPNPARPQQLVMRPGIAKFKTKDHGIFDGLPRPVNKKISASDLKTFSKALKAKKNADFFMMDVLETFVYDPNSCWLENGTYKGGTDYGSRPRIYFKDTN